MQKMQKKMAEAQEELGEQRIEGLAGGGMVKLLYPAIRKWLM